MYSKKNSIRFLILGVVLSIVVSGCAFNKPQGGDDKQTVLNWVMPGPGKQEDADKVWAQFNTELQKKLPNTKVQFDIIPTADFGERWKLMSAANEKTDIVWGGYMIQFGQMIRGGSYKQLDELLDKSAPELKNSLPDWVWNTTRVDGKIYAVPNYQQLSSRRVMYFPKDFSDKYLNMVEFEKVFAANDYMTKETYAEMEKYLAALKQNGSINKGTGFLYDIFQKGYVGITSNFYAKINDNDYKVYDWYKTPEYKLYIDTKRDWFKKGYIRTDVLSNKDIRADDGKKDGSVLWAHSGDKKNLAAYNKRFSIPIDMAYIDRESTIAGGLNVTATAISKNCKDDEKAIKLLQLMNTPEGKELYNMLVYGIEGEHYSKVSDNKIEVFEGPGGTKNKSTTAMKYGLTKWVVGNTFNSYETQSDTPGWSEYVKNELDGKAKKSPISGFLFNTDPVKTELAQIDAIGKEYVDVLASGAMENYEETFKIFLEKLKIAGSEKVLAEVQKQLDEWVKVNK
jgi:putative aldouronate transport system substrate-binding protein